LTFRHYKGGRSSAKHTSRLYPRRNPWYSLSKAESTSGHMTLSGVQRKKSSVTPPGIDPGTVRLVAQRLNHYATPGPNFTSASLNVHVNPAKTGAPFMWLDGSYSLSISERAIYQQTQIHNFCTSRLSLNF